MWYKTRTEGLFFQKKNEFFHKNWKAQNIPMDAMCIATYILKKPSFQVIQT